jgi:hypothetical protein
MTDTAGWERDEWRAARDHDDPPHPQPTRSAEQRRPWEGVDPDEDQP